MTDTTKIERDSQLAWWLDKVCCRNNGLFLSKFPGDMQARIEIGSLQYEGLVTVQNEGDGGLRVRHTEKGLALWRELTDTVGKP